MQLVRVKELSQNEARAHQIIQRTLADTGWWISTNVSVQSVLQKDRSDGWMSDMQFSLYTRGAFDFVVYDPTYCPAFALEVDGPQHDDENRRRRDLLKNWLCARADFPLLRLRADTLHEDEETSVLAWLVSMHVAAARESDEDPLDVEPDIDEEPQAGDDESALAGEELDRLLTVAGTSGDPEFSIDDLHAHRPDADDFVLGEPGIELDHEFPDMALLRTRLSERWGITIGQRSPLLVVGSRPRYVLELRWPPAFTGPSFRLGAASEYVVDEVSLAVASLAQPDDVLFSGKASAEFAWANRLPTTAGPDRGLAPIDLPWDAWGIARQLAEFAALAKVERWARRALA
jgi:hypothetical protein